jgi:multimeric flavodoxin WrbA
MKVIAFNGSPKSKGNTAQALQLVMDELEKQGIETEMITVGNKKISGCVACNQCVKKQNEQCSITSDGVNEWIQKMKEADGILLGTPVHYASMSGNMKSFLDRAFYVCGVNGGLLRHKVGAAIAAVRRSGGLPAFNDMMHFLTYAEMMIPTSNYWNVIHGLSPGQIHEDEEGVQIMEVLGQNMAYLLQLIENGKGTVTPPAPARKKFTHFVR